MTKQKDETFNTFIKNHYSKKGQAYTHTRIGDKNLSIKGGSYTINDDEIESFFQKYYNHVFVERNQEYLTEKQLSENGPILVDLDFRYSTDVETRPHTKEQIIDIIQLYCEKISEIVNVEKNVAIPIFVFEKDKVNLLDDVTKDGIHIIIGIQMNRILQIMLRNRIVSTIKNVIGDLPLINSCEEVLDEGITKGHTNWQLYGSRKPGHKAYVLTHHYNLSLNDEDEWIGKECNISSFNLSKNIRLLSAQYTKHISFEMLGDVESEYNNTKASSKSNKAKKKLKIISNTEDITISDIKNAEILDEALERLLEETNKDSTKYDIIESHDYVMTLPSTYYGPGSYNKWIRVGWALKNTSPKLFLSWLKFSSQENCRGTLKGAGGTFDWDNVTELYEIWKSFVYDNPDGLTKRSIMYWSKNDAPEKYKMVYKNTIDYFIKKTVEIQVATEFDLATVLYTIFKDRFVCVSIKNNVWYEFIGNRWLEIDSGSTLRLLISKDMHTIYVKKSRTLINKMSHNDANDPEFKNQRQEVQRYTEICINLRKTNSKNNIMREARELFYDKDFMTNLDNKAHLLCFKNGVIDFNNKVFRKGQPDDNISKCTNIDYVKLNKKHDKMRNEVDEFMEQLFPIKELREYMWEHLASCLIGTNSEQTFNIYTGSGSNGKSKLVELMGLCLGEYKATVPITLITQKRNSIGSTSSEIVQLMGTRYAVMQEPSKGDKINEGIMKEITGGDPIQGRALFKDTITFVPQFKLVVCTNTLFDIKSNDDGTWRRIRVCDFKSKFCNNPVLDDKDEPYQFKIDKHMEGKLKKWAPIYLSMLVEKAFETNGDVKSSDIVMGSSDNYRDGQDYLAEFIKENIQVEEGGKIKKQEVYEHFKEWYKLNIGRNIPKGRELYDYIDKKLVKYNKSNRCWVDIAIIYDDNDETI